MKQKFLVGDWLVNPNENTLTKHDKVISIEPKAMALLCMLAEAKGKVVSREDIMLQIWNDRYVTDYALNNLISSLRKHLKHEDRKESYIKTRPKLGYQMLAEVSSLPSENTKRQSSGNQSGVAAQPVNFEAVADADTSRTQNHTTNKKKYLALGIALTFVMLVSIFAVYFIHNPEEYGAPERSIAVLPFAVYEESSELDYFAEGLADEIIHQLNTLDDFKVISRRSSFTYRDKEIDVAQIASELDVIYILEGSVRKEQDAIRTTLQLVDTQDESILWSRVFTASSQNGFSIQYEISDDIAKSMDADFTSFPEDKRRFSPQSGEAFLHVLRGRKLNQSSNAEARLRARDEFKMATLLEPEFALAHIDLAVSYLLLQQNKQLDSDQADTLVTESIEKALKIDPNLAEAHAAYAIFYYNKGMFDLAKSSFEKALDANPKLYLALVNYANLLRAYYYPEESLIYYERALKRAPLSGIVYWGIAQNQQALGRFEDAISSYQKCLDRSVNNTSCLKGLAYAYRLLNYHEEADNTFKRLKPLVGQNDYYYNMAQAWHALQTNDAETASNIMDAKVAQYGLDIPLQTITYAKIGLGQVSAWFERLSQAPNPETRGLAFTANYANAAFFNGECETAIEYYGLMNSQQPNLLHDADVLANGVTYLANLIHCYRIMGDKDKADDRLKQLNSLLTDLSSQASSDESSQPGIIFAHAQYAVLVGDRDKAEKHILSLKQSKWGLKWLLEKDPILLSLRP